MAIEHLTNVSHEDLEKIISALTGHPQEFKFTEKYDGTCNASMSIKRTDSDEIMVGLTRPAKGRHDIIYSQDHFSSSPNHNCFRRALSVFHAIASLHDLGNFMNRYEESEIIIEFEILIGARPNTIRYGTNNKIIPLRIIGPQTLHNKEIFNNFVAMIRDEVYPIDVPLYEYSLEPEEKVCLKWARHYEEFDVHMIREFTFRQLDEHFELSTPMNPRERIRALNKGIGHVNSSLNQGVPVEGIIIHHEPTATMYKIVDKKKFTKDNNLIWDVRSLIAGGRMKNGKWRKSYYQLMLDDMAEILTVPILKTPMAIKYFRDDHDKAARIVDTAIDRLAKNPNVLATLYRRHDKYSKQLSSLFVRYVHRQEQDDPPYDEEVHWKTMQSFHHMDQHNKKILEPIDKLMALDPDDPKCRLYVKKLLFRLVIVV